MRCIIELALEATGKVERFLDALEKNPSRLALINAGIMFEELLRNELARCRGYSKKALELSFGALVELAKTEFNSNPENWALLKNLSKLRDCAATFTSTRMPLGDIIPQAIRQRFPEAALSAPSLDFLQPKLAEAWKFLTQFTYMHVFYQIRMAAAPLKQEELAGEFRQVLDNISEYLSGPEGVEMLAQFSEPEKQEQGA